MGVNGIDQVQAIEGKMLGVIKELEKLAPHPSKHEYSGPLFVQSGKSSDNDGMLGTMMLETMLGTAFATAVTENSGETLSSFDMSNVADGLSEYYKDRQTAKPTYSLNQRNAITGSFNAISNDNASMEAYLRDLPRRLGLEQWLCHYQRKLYALRKASMTYAPKMAA